MQNIVRPELEYNALAISPEQMLLGAMIADPRATAQALQLCRPAMLRDPFHRRIFEAARHAVGQGETITADMMRARLASDPAWATIPSDYLTTLRLAAPVTKTVPQLVDMVRAEIGKVPVEGRRDYLLHTVAGLSDVSPDYLVKGLIAPGEMSVIYGDPGSGKSFLAAWMGYNVALGHSVFGRRVRRAPVVYAALEGQIGFARRLKALREHLGHTDSFYWLDQSVDLRNAQDDIDGLIDAVLKTGAKWLVIDTLARAIGGGAENEGQDMGLMIQAQDQISRETGAHVSFVHHTGKDNTRGMRGHSSLNGATNGALEVKRDGDARSAKVVKSKDGQDGDEFGFALDVVDLGQDDDGDPITTCIVIPGDVVDRMATQKVPARCKGALDLLDKAIAEAGEPAPETPHIPFQTRTIRLSVWRKYCDAGLFADNDKPDSKRKAFVRVTQKLQELGLIGVWNEFAWRKR